MQQLVKIRKLFDDGTAEVVRIRESACSGDCHKCSGCGATQQTMLLRAENPIQAKPGQVVTIRTDAGPVLAAAAVLYLLPLVLFFAGYLVFEQLWSRGGLGGLLAFGLGLIIAAAYDRLVAKKRPATYTITGFAHSDMHFSNKGDNDLD